MARLKPKVLAAFPAFALPIVQHALGGAVDLIPVASLEEAEQRLQGEPPVALVMCGVHFDESRMYDLLRYSRRSFPGLPFICCRILDAEIPRISREALALAAESLGAAAFVDLPELAHAQGQNAAEEALRAAVVAQLPGYRSAC